MNLESSTLSIPEINNATFDFLNWPHLQMILNVKYGVKRKFHYEIVGNTFEKPIQCKLYSTNNYYYEDYAS